MITDLAFVASGLAAGIFSGSLGVGGALLAQPLIRFLGVSPYFAIGTTVPVLFPTTVVGALTYRRSGLVDMRAARWTALGGVGAAVAGAFTTRLIPGDGHVLMLLTATVLFTLALRILIQRDSSATAAGVPSPAGLISLGVVTGFLSGLLGIGGGFLMVPVFIRLFGVPIKTALGTSLAVISLTAIPNLVAQQLVGNIHWGVAFRLAIGVIPGAWFGARLAIRTQERVLRMIVATALIAVAIIFALSELSALSSR